MVDTAADFGGSVPEHYDTILGPAQFAAIAADLVRRMPVRPKGDVLELACGTGLVTARLRERVDPFLRVVATDVSDDMLGYARSKVRGKIDWRKADAAALPFKDATFGAVVCGLGVMFVADKRKLFAESRRVLVEGGMLLFNCWDRLENNPHSNAAADAFARLFPGDPEMEFTRLPYSFHDEGLIGGLLAEARFSDMRFDKFKVNIKAPSARAFATGMVRGTPRVMLIEKKGADVEKVVDEVALALAAAGGAEPFTVQGSVVVVQAKAV
jgi:SAM-dependent methyltransferase